MSKEFNEALGKFITDFADGGAVRHLAATGMSISEIQKHLDYPLPREKVAAIIWEHYVNTGIICLEEPKSITERISYVKEQDKYGKISMRRVVEQIDASDKKYIKLDFGKQLYKNKTAFTERLEGLAPEDREYVLTMPWPLQDVYHVLDERMQRIHAYLMR
ncbi:MAG: hypothetical protein K6A05_09625 [Lachnospiraceae bacterium]|nr:hypothetical protein [Lachnospiraceae bacterium]